MSNIKEFASIPEVSFIDDISAQQVRDDLITDYKAKVKSLTGDDPTISAGSPERLVIYAFAAQLYQVLAYIDNAAKMGILKYSKGDFLDNLGLLRGLTRRPATPASCTVKFTLSDVRNSATSIPAGTRLSAGSIYFLTKEYLEIPAGENEGTVTAIAENTGTDANGLNIGQITTLVDTIAYIDSVTNTTATSGGTDIETDDSFTLRIYKSPAGYSVAGPTDAYIWHAQNAIADIGDVVAYTPEPGHVEIAFTMSDGSLPGDEKIKQVEETLNDKTIRPLTDTVKAKAPEEIDYKIEFTYYIAQSNINQVATIQNEVENAVTAYKQWQRHIGRDVTASKLIQMVMAAGAKRVEVTAPSFIPLEKTQLSKCTDQVLTYGGLEDD